VKKTYINGAAIAARSPPVDQRHLHGVGQRRDGVTVPMQPIAVLKGAGISHSSMCVFRNA
jgi:hypothetical protein